MDEGTTSPPPYQAEVVASTAEERAVGLEGQATRSAMERLTAMEATLVEFTTEMETLRRAIRREIKELKKSSAVGGVEVPRTKKAKKRKGGKEGKEGKGETPDRASPSSAQPTATSAVWAPSRPSMAAGSSFALPPSYDPDALATTSLMEEVMHRQSNAQQRQLNEYLASFEQRLAEERKRRKTERQKRASRINRLERELKDLRENVMQSLTMDARKVELIQKRDTRIKQLEDLIKKEEEQERQLTTTDQERRWLQPRISADASVPVLTEQSEDVTQTTV